MSRDPPDGRPIVGHVSSRNSSIVVLTSLQSTPSSGPSVMTQKVLALVGQADGRYVRHVLYRPVQSEHGHVEPIGLWRELEERMHADLAHAERVRRQRFHRRIDHIVAKRYLYLTGWCSAGRNGEGAVKRVASFILLQCGFCENTFKKYLI